MASMKNMRSIAWAITVAFVFSAQAQANSGTFEGAEFKDHYEWNDTPFLLHGAGVLQRFFDKGYAAALYLGEGVPPERALDDVPRRIEIEYFRAIPSEEFVFATIKGVLRNVNSADHARIRGSVGRLNGLYQDVEPGDRYALTYIPGVGTELSLNGESKGLIEGAEFSAALFAIWIGEGALDESLRAELLALDAQPSSPPARSKPEVESLRVAHDSTAVSQEEWEESIGEAENLRMEPRIGG